MSIRVMSAVWEHSEAEGVELLVLLAIADCASDDGGNAWPSIATLSRKTRVSARTVQRAIRTLEARGEMVVQLNAGMRGANVYKVTTAPRQAVTPEAPAPEPTPANLTPVTLSPRESDGVTPVTPRGDKGVTRIVKNHPSSPNAPAKAGRGGSQKRAHCLRHTRYVATCDNCRRLEHPPPPKPSWCGQCDEKTRLANYDSEKPYRCPDCHPLEVEATA